MGKDVNVDMIEYNEDGSYTKEYSDAIDRISKADMNTMSEEDAGILFFSIPGSIPSKISQSDAAKIYYRGSPFAPTISMGNAARLLQPGLKQLFSQNNPSAERLWRDLWEKEQISGENKND